MICMKQSIQQVNRLTHNYLFENWVIANCQNPPLYINTSLFLFENKDEIKEYIENLPMNSSLGAKENLMNYLVPHKWYILISFNDSETKKTKSVLTEYTTIKKQLDANILEMTILSKELDKRIKGIDN